MGSLTQAKKGWEEVVAVKRQAQVDLLGSFSHDKSLKDVTALDNAHASIRASDIVDCLTRRDVTCEELVKSYINKSVICSRRQDVREISVG